MFAFACAFGCWTLAACSEDPVRAQDAAADAPALDGYKADEGGADAPTPGDGQPGAEGQPGKDSQSGKDSQPGKDGGKPTTYACPPGAGPKLEVGAGKVHATIASALKAAKAGDTIVVADGVYNESLTVTSGGSAAASRLTLCAAHRRKATIRSSSRALKISAPWVTVLGFVVDGQWGSKDIVQADDKADNLVLRDLEIHSGKADGIDIGGGSAGGCTQILIDDCTIHHLLAGSASASNQLDAHCIVATDIKGLTIRDTEAYYCSGDAVQVGTDRDRWDGLTIDRCKLWTGPLPAAAAGFKKGESPGENALDTKANVQTGAWKGTVTLRDSVFYGFDLQSAYISNRSALNLKNQITGLVERCTLYDNEIGLRIRGGTGARGGVDGLLVRNVVLYRNQYHARLEDEAKNVNFHHNTFGQLIDAAQKVLAPSSSLYLSNAYKGGGGGHEGPGWVSDNNLFVGSNKPQRATGAGDKATLATTSTWVNYAGQDYHLKADQNAAKGVGVKVDRDGKARSASTPDVGAYER